VYLLDNFIVRNHPPVDSYIRSSSHSSGKSHLIISLVFTTLLLHVQTGLASQAVRTVPVTCHIQWLHSVGFRIYGKNFSRWNLQL